MTVRISLPSGVPDTVKPNVYTSPLALILVAIESDNVAVPPARYNAKLPATIAPLPLLLLKTASLMVTATRALFAFTTTETMDGDN